MRKLILPLFLASLALSPLVFAQQDQPKQTQQEKQTRAVTRQQQSYNMLVDQYATASLGYMIEQRCRQTADTAFQGFQESQDLLDGFMLILMGKDDYVKLVEGLKKTALDVTTNPCNVDTFKFALATAQISSSLATQVQLLGEDELIKLNKLLHGKTKTAAQNDGDQPALETPVQTGQPQGQEPEYKPGPTEPQTTFDTLTPTYVERQPEPVKPATQPATETQSQPQAAQTQTQAQSGILPANYVNPYAYSASPPPPGETEKDMKRRQRQEIIDLRRAQRAELDAFKDNKDTYADPDAIERAIKDRQDAEFDAMRNRHQQELGRF